jgi:hypothetical protein
MARSCPRRHRQGGQQIMTHTPGPWFANRHQVETKDRIVASKLNQHDANLIAAAPDMLEALKEIANGKPWQDRFRVFVAIARYQKTARAAIAKAEGK